MKNNFKFRAWHKDKKVFLYRSLFDSHWSTSDGSWTILAIDHDRIFLDVEQYTGLKDNAEKEIYEGDIVNFTYWWFDGAERDTNLKGVIVYLPEFMSYGLKHVKNSEWCSHVGADTKVGDTNPFATWRFEGDDFEIIGNIHSNPELLEEVET